MRAGRPRSQGARAIKKGVHLFFKKLYLYPYQTIVEYKNLKQMKFSLFLVAMATGMALSGQSPLLLRHPAVNNDGSLVAFSFQGDIWTVPSAGGKATRLTIHEAHESNPVFSPDGKQIAFSGGRYGNNDVYVMPTEGGTPRRLTFHSAGDNIASWTRSGEILFSTNREFRLIERPQEVYAVSPTGGTERRVLDAVGFDPVYSPDGRFLAFVRGDINPVFREDYRGPSNRELWIYDTRTKKFSKLPGFETNDILPQWADARTLYFLSSNDGAYNLYRMKLDDSGKAASSAEKLTNFKEESIRHYSISADGKTIVFEKDMHLYLLKGGKGNGQKIEIAIRPDERFDPMERKTLSNGAGDLAISPNGKLLAFTVRGEVFVKEADKEKSRSINISNHAYRDMNPAWLNDSTLLFCSDRNGGNFEFYLARSADAKEGNLFKTLKRNIVQLTNSKEDESAPVVSPDGRKIAFVRGRGDLVVAEMDSTGRLGNEKLLQDGWDTPSGISWSPDSKWLAYAISDLYFNQEVFIHAADNSSKPVNISMHPRQDGRPAWSPDGSKLGFTSARNGRNNDVWFVWLKKSDWEKASQDWQEDEKPAAPAARNNKQGPPTVQIDFDRIHERVVQVTSFPGEEGDVVISQDGETFFYTGSSSTARGRDLYSIKWDGKELKELTKGGSNPSQVQPDREGKYLYFGRMGSFARLDAKSGLQEPLPFSAVMEVDYTAEREQVFEEAWRTIRDGFYDPQFHGYDWNALREKYRERCIYASTATDFRDMFNLLLGEINASHMSLTAPERSETQRESTGMLGAELMPEADGMRVVRVIPESPADKGTSKLNPGDLLLSVNGERVGASQNFYELLNGRANEKTLLEVRNAAGETRELVIRPVQSLGDLLYQEWVEGRKKLVEAYSKGRIGYIHVRGMDIPSFETMEREFTAAGYGKDGILVDVRYNGGGSTADYLMAVLNYKQHAYTIPRGASEDLEKDKLKFREYYPTGERLIFSPWLKPSAALCNEGSYSNAEIFSHAYKSLGIGKLVGQPTNGSVISTGGRALLDGSFVRLPFRGWFTKATDQNQELGPAVPDILVENSPDWIARGVDEQLKAAVDALLKDIR